MHVEVGDGIHWVGVVDWNVRDFHGYETLRGSSYNAYLVQDQNTALIDTVKAPFAADLLRNISELTDPGGLDYVIVNHAEPDHSGALAAVVQACPRASLVVTAKTRDILSLYNDTSGWNFEVVSSGDSLSLGRRSLTFVETPMVHWPDSGVAYMPEEKLLFSNDAFGQHLAASGHFDDQVPFDVLMAEAKTYYANIVMPYGKQVLKTLEKASGLDLEVIAPAHGIIWRTHLADIAAAYSDWAVCRPTPKVLIIYDTMWKSTEKMAHAILEGASRPGVQAKLFWVRASSRTVLATEALDAATFACGSPTLNGHLMPQAASVLTYLKGLAPQGKAGLAFGSYGWGKQGPSEVQRYLEDMKVEVLREPIVAQFSPTAEALDECRAAGRLLADRAEEMASVAST